MDTERHTLWVGIVLALTLLISPASAGEASTHFALYVPPNNSNNGRHSAVTVTAHSNDTTVFVTDSDEDGDSDDSTSAVLSKGQSIVVQIRDGSVNDGAGGKWDGDTIVIDSDKPVVAMLSTRSEWQHDWVPAEGQTMRGHEFFMWSPRPGWDIDTIAYEDDTLIEIYDITSVALENSGVSSVTLPGTILLRQTLNAGEDLLNVLKRAGTNLTEAGHTYRVLASKPVTCMYGSFYQRERDGGGYVPSEQGTTSGKHFYFPVPAGRWTPHEREIRIVAGGADSIVTLRGWSPGAGWVDISTSSVSRFGHLDFTGRENRLVKEHAFFEIVATEAVNVFEGNWLETGNIGTSDVFSYVSSLDGQGSSDVGREFVVYVGPPGRQNRAVGNEGNFSHLYLASFEAGTQVQITDVDTGGTRFSRDVVMGDVDNILDVKISTEEYNLLNRPAENIRPFLRLSASAPVSVGVANWNDNWLAFPSGSVPPGLDVSVSSPARAQCNQTLNFEIATTNRSEETLSDIALEVSAVGATNLLGTLASIASLKSGESNLQVLTGVVDCSDVATGQLAGVEVISSAERADAQTVAAKETVNLSTLVPDVVGIVSVVASPDACSVELKWVTDEDNGDTEYLVLRRELGARGSFEQVGRVPSLAPAASGFVYGFRDVSVSLASEYQYMISAVDPDTGSELSVAGPTIARTGDPIAVVPEASGDVGADFSSVGLIVRDGEDAVGVPGLDVDRIGVAYDPYNDSLYLGVSAQGVFGDMDGDEDPDTSSVETGVDRPRFSDDEQFAFVLDLDLDGEGDVVVGIPFGGDIDFLQATSATRELVESSPTLAFEPQTVEQSGTLSIQVLSAPSASKPDMEFVLRNASTLNGGEPLGEFGIAFYAHASSATDVVERLPERGYSEVTGGAAVTASCGQPPSQVHLGVFAAFGNVFTGTPRFDFVPYGWSQTESGEVLASAPTPVDNEIITSPTVFLPEQYVDIQGVLNPRGLDLPGQHLRVKDRGVLHSENFVLTTEMEWDYPAASGEERYENIDVQVFRLVVTDCTTTVHSKQYGPAGSLLDDRFVRLADDSVVDIGPINPANILAHSVFGTFETEGAVRNLHRSTPEDWIDDFGSPTAPEFTRYAFLSDQSYVEDIDVVEVTPFGEQGVELPAGIWFINYYLWSYANAGVTRIETTFSPGSDCGGSL